MISLGEKYIRKRMRLSDSAPLGKEARENAEYFEETFQCSYNHLLWFDTDDEAARYIQQQPEDKWFERLICPESLRKKTVCLLPRDDGAQSDPEPLVNVGGFEQLDCYFGGENPLKEMRERMDRLIEQNRERR